jgi:uncharacterized membrane protein (GlpM family)
MEKQQSRDYVVRQKKLKRRNFILKTWGLLKSFFVWLKETITFKKTIVVFCIWYIVNFIEYLKSCYESGFYFPTELAITIITAFLVELGLTALNSVKSKKYNYENECDIEREDYNNYG